MPIYDVWSALFYFLWYQPKQINVAYRIINSVRNGAPLVGNRRLHVIDLGCGALAMKFGVALALADTISRGKPAARVRIDSADVCAPMIQLGDDAWDTFVDRIAQDPAMGSLREACQLIDGASIVADAIDDFAQLVPRQDGAEVWLSALHTVYDENIRGVQEALAYLVDHFHPDLGIITSIDLKEDLVQSAIDLKEDLVQSAGTSFLNRGYDAIQQDLQGLAVGLHGALPITTEYRREFVGTYNGARENLWETTVALLQGAVDCEPQPVHCLVYTAR